MSPLAPDVDDDRMEQISDRFERRLLEETSKLDAKIADVRLDVAGLRSEVREGFTGVRADMARDRFELLKWAFAFWIGQFFATAALLTALARR
jgi:hypothetical protein